MRIKVSDLSTYTNECERKFFYDSLEFMTQKNPFFSFTLGVMDLIKECVFKNNKDMASKYLEERLSLIRDDWFLLNKEKEQRVEWLRKVVNRYFDFELVREKEIVSKNVHYVVKKVVNGEEVELQGKVDFVFRYPDGQYEAVKYRLGAPKLSSAARKPENKPESSLELALCYEGLKGKYPNLIVSYYHLKHKDDTSTDIKEVFNDKKNKNIVTAVFDDSSAVATLKKLEELDLKKLSDLKTEYQYEQNKDNCDLCLYKRLCNGQSVVEMKPLAKKPKEFVPNSKQKEVIKYIDGPMRVVAGPGTGKTGTMVARYVNMIKQGIKPQNILLLSFSNKAVDELKERITSLTSLPMDMLEAYTYNSFCFNILKKYQELLSMSGTIKLISRKDLLGYIVDFLNKRINDYNVEVSFVEPLGKFGIITRIEKVVSIIIERDWLEKSVEELGNMLGIDDMEMMRLYKDCAVFIRTSMKENNQINYSDQIRLTEKLLQEHPALSKQLSKKYKYIIVDEFQDTDEFQCKILYSIAKHHGNICVVGDDDQSIFGWRNAKVENILKFHDAFPNCRDVILTENYRSTRSIVELSSEFIRKNQARIKKRIHAINQSNNLSVMYNEIKQLDDIVPLLKELLKNYEPNDIAIISRKNSTLYKLEEILWKDRIPSKKKANSLRENIHFYNMLVYLEMSLANSYVDLDDISVYCYLRDIAKVNMANIPSGSNIKRAIADSIYYDRLAKDMEWMYLMTQFESFGVQLQEMIRYLALPKPIVTFLERTVEEEKITSFAELYKYLYDIELYQEEITIEDDVTYDAVNLLTSHVSKGLEFPVVIVADLNEFIQEDEEDEEERRVLYVTLTRAKEKLILLDKETKNRSIYSDEIFGLLNLVEAV